MHKLNKKGDVKEFTNWIIGGIISIVLILSLIYLSVNLYKTFSEERKDVECKNGNEWLKIQRVLERLDNSEITSDSILFDNDDCKLASFTITQQLQEYKIKPPHVPGKYPELCLCKVDGDACGKYECLKFKDFDAIVGPTNSQFTTLTSKRYGIITFQKDNKILRVSAQEKEPEPIYYKYEQRYAQLDENHLVDEMQVIFTTNQISSYVPIIKQLDNYPQEIPNAQGITKSFTLQLANKPASGLDITYYKSNPRVIDNSLIKDAIVSFRIPKDDYERLPANERNLRLYYYVDNAWQSVPLDCGLAGKNYLCGTFIDKFVNEYVISKGQEETSRLELDKDLNSFIERVSAENGISPNLVKAIIKVESNGNPKAVSPCGAAGITQMIRATAMRFGLKVPGYGNSEASVCNNLVVSNCRSDQTNFCNFNSEEDERFDAKKEIEASVKYLRSIKEILAQNNIEPSIANIAAAYNQGEGKVIEAKGIPQVKEALNYVAKVTNIYKDLSVEESELAAKQQEVPPA